VFDALILEAPAFGLHEDSVKWYHILGAKLLNWILPDFKLGRGNNSFVSRNKDVCDEVDRLEPEFGDNGGMMAHTAYQMLEVQTKLMTELNQIQVKTLICHGTNDRVCSFQGSEQAHNQMPNSQLKLYESAYHCLHDELPETTHAYLIEVFFGWMRATSSVNWLDNTGKYAVSVTFSQGK
jgi:alpha-beta hydrolase superfamily lysophospholipase